MKTFLLKRIRRNQNAASPAISAVIITAVTVVLVLIAGNYAYQILEQQRGASEFDTVQKSILAYDDAVRDVAWEKGASRSTRFTVNYGQLELIADEVAKGGLPLAVNVTDYQGAAYSSSTGYVRYTLSTRYVTLGNQYQSYILGNNKTVTTKSTESFGRALIRQESGWVSVTLNYGVRAMKTYTVNVTQSGNQTVQVSYVDIWIIKMKIDSSSTSIGNLDLTAKCLNVITMSYGGDDGNGYAVVDGECNVHVQLGEESDTAAIPLDGEKVVFNFIIAEIEVLT